MNNQKLENHPEILDEMMKDLAEYNGALGPGPYWADNQQTTLTWLRNNDLNTFRSFERNGKGLNNFGGGSWWPFINDTQENQSTLYNGVLHRVFQKLKFGPGI